MCDESERDNQTRSVAEKTNPIAAGQRRERDRRSVHVIDYSNMGIAMRSDA